MVALPRFGRGQSQTATGLAVGTEGEVAIPVANAVTRDDALAQGIASPLDLVYSVAGNRSTCTTDDPDLIPL